MEPNYGAEHFSYCTKVSEYTDQAWTSGSCTRTEIRREVKSKKLPPGPRPFDAKKPHAI